MNQLVKTQLFPIILSEKVCSWTDVTQGNWGFLLPVMKCENEGSFSFHHDKHQWQCNRADPFLWTVMKFFSPAFYVAVNGSYFMEYHARNFFVCLNWPCVSVLMWNTESNWYQVEFPLQSIMKWIGEMNPRNNFLLYRLTCGSPYRFWFTVYSAQPPDWSRCFSQRPEGWSCRKP